MENNNSVEMTLADVIGGSEGTEANQAEAQGTPAQTESSDGNQPEPGYVQRRIQHALRETEAKYEGQLAELRNQVNALTEANLAVQARERVAAGDFKNEELAMEYLRMKNGLPAPQKETVDKPRDEHGRFTKVSDVPAELQQKANELMAQAQAIQKATGVDVLGMYNQNPDIQQKVLSGEWDFADVMLNAGEAVSQKRAPAPVRGTSHVGIGNSDFSKMSSAEFAKVNELLKNGGTIDMRK